MAGAAHCGAAAHEEALEISRHAATRDDHGQAPFLRRGKGEDGPSPSTSPAQGAEQSRGELSSANETAPRIMKRFKSARQAQRFLSVHDQVANLFHVPYPEKATAEDRRAARDRAFAVWRNVSGTVAAP
jgi:hypothetical protein